MAILLTICDIINRMKFIEKNNERIIVNLFGLRLKFHRKISQEALLRNYLYELADKRTFEDIKLPKIINIKDSLNLLQETNKSLARYGDGEFKLMMGESISFQKYDEKLAGALQEIITNKNEKLFVGLPDVFGKCYSDYFRKVMIFCREFLYRYINFDNIYVDSMLTRRLKFDSEQTGNEYFLTIKKFWQNKDIIIVEGAGSRLGVGNDLFNGAKSIERILCPIKDAFSKYDEILTECLKQPTNKLFILALGPTATVLADDLSRKGYRALDIGHLDTAYEAFLRKSDKFVHVEGKIVFNEERHNNLIQPCKDENYNKQIIAKIN